MKADLISTAADLQRLEAEWWALFHRTPNATPFSTPAWLLPWWHAFAPGTLFSVAVRHEAKLVALAPLYLEDGPGERRLLPLGIGVSDEADVLIDPDHAEVAASVLFDAIGAEAVHWDQWCAEEAAPGASVLSFAAPPGWTSDIASQSACPLLSLPPTLDGLRDAIGARKLRKWRMAQNRTSRRAWSLNSTTSETLGDDLAHLFRLHGARWGSKGEAGVLVDEAVRRFHALAAPALFKAGLLRLFTLRIDAAMAGVYYGLRRGTSAFAYLGGFDPDFAFESPGTVLVGHAIEDAVRTGATAFNFLRGQEAYKYEWGAVDRWNSRRTFRLAR